LNAELAESAENVSYSALSEVPALNAELEEFAEFAENVFYSAISAASAFILRG
jgi:hypothetical protein